jgi:hypothetical protein
VDCAKEVLRDLIMLSSGATFNRSALDNLAGEVVQRATSAFRGKRLQHSNIRLLAHVVIIVVL